ncbi:MAG TPA: NAD(P)H-binding protein [Ktedonobacterales bacterium]|nr:NAD(P)H-binding protein [Ktedonobacterales bacterium]
MSTVLVTGGTGTLGRAVVARLLNRPHRVRILSHQAHPVMPAAVEVAPGDLVSGAGLREAARGVEVIIHCATNWRDPLMRTDVAGTRALLQAARAGGLPHILYISIVGVDRTEYPYYRAKWEVEQMVAQSGFPWTVLRATQYHPFVQYLLQSCGADTQPEVVVPGGIRMQSIDVGEVADRLVLLLERGPSGQTPEMGGPQILSLEAMAQVYVHLRGRQATIRSAEPTDEMYTMMRTGIIVTPAHAEGKITWEQYLQHILGKQPAPAY